MEKQNLVLVDGAAGYLGQHLVSSFIQAGHPVRATDLPGSDLSGPESQGAEIVYSDLLDPASLKSVCQGADWVVHSAAAFDLGLPYSVLKRVNVDGTANLCHVMVESGASKLLHISTGGVYGKSQFSPVTEDHPYNPVDAYSRSKYEAEKVVEHHRKENGLYALFFRPTALYGPGGRYIASAFMTVLAIAREKGVSALPLFSGGQELNWVHVKDVAEAAVFVLEKDGIPSGEAFNLGDSDIMTAEDFFGLYYRAFGIEPGRRIRIPKPLFNFSMAAAAMLASEFTLGPLNRWLERTWKEIVDKHRLKPELFPKISRDQFHFLAGDHAYDNSKLVNAGYVFQHPKFEKGFLETVDWYQKEAWIPSLD